MKYFLHPLGCAANKADTERIAAMLQTAGYTPAETELDAQVIGIVACSIRQSAIDRIYGKVHHWNKRKQREQLVTFVSGCILPADEKKFLKLFDLVVKLNDMPQLPRMLQEYGTVAPQSFWEINPVRASAFKALVPIQNGCNKFCTFCAVPYTRGREVSRPSTEILQEITSLIAQGYAQITLLGQNVNSYGLDKPKKEMTFAELLNAIGEMADKAPRNIWVHYTSPHPRDMTAEVLQVQSAHRSLANYLNLPLQSGNNDILKRMNRRYTVEHYMSILDEARTIIPNLTVSTDIIVGFCGETAQQFEDTVRAMERGVYDLAFIAQYSPRPGAVAERRFADDIEKEEKKRRAQTLTEVLKRSAAKNNARLVGHVLPVLVETCSRKDEKMLGRTEGLKSVEFVGDPSLVGQFTQMKITNFDPWRLYGELVEPVEK